MKNKIQLSTVLELAVVAGLVVAGITLFKNFTLPGEASLAENAAAIAPAAGDEIEDPLAWQTQPAAPEMPTQPVIDPLAPPPEVSAVPPAAPVDVPSPAAMPPPPEVPVADQTPAAVEAPVASPMAASDDRIEKIEGRLMMLEKSIDEMGRMLVTKSDLDRLRAEMGGMQGMPPPAAVKKERPKKAAVKKSPPAPQWILKSAKPGEAWVAQKGSAELRTVVIGDTLPGLGKITAIGRDSMGQWVVNGTKGRINQ